MKKSVSFVAALVATCLHFTGVQAETVEPTVNVKLVNYVGNKAELTLVPTGNYTTSDPAIVLQSGVSYQIKAVNGKTVLYQNNLVVKTFDHFQATPVDEANTLSVNQRTYLGSFDFVIENNQYVRPVNSLYMEDYLKGVVPIEMYASWNVEALKAQAVAARTYAMTYSNAVINDTTTYQVYGGKVWTDNSNKAVDATEGQVLKYNNALISAVFSASNGGITESNGNAWGGTNVAYLPVKNDSFDTQSSWSFSFNKKQLDLTGKDLTKPELWWSTTKETDTTISTNIKTWLASNGYANKEIKLVNIPTFALYEPNSSGRATKGNVTVEFYVKDMKDATGKLALQTVSFTGDKATKVRSMFGALVMRSYLITDVNSTTDIVTVKGKGDGHGVGMSQWGAKYRADAGQTYNQILDFYYPGAALVTAFTKHTPVPTVLDKTAPSITNYAVSYDGKTKKATITYKVNESVKSTLYVKDKNGNKTYLERENKRKEGIQTIVWDVSKVVNGTYTLGLITADDLNNQSSAVLTKTIDTTSPLLSGLLASYDMATKKITTKYTLNEEANVTLYAKNASGKVVTYLQNDVKKSAGTQFATLDATSLVNGSYTFVLSATDANGNTSSATWKYTLAKPLTGVVKSSSLTVRATASYSGKPLGYMKAKQAVVITKTSGAFYEIQYGSKKGYVASNFITNVN